MKPRKKQEGESDEEEARVQKLQARINDALIESGNEEARQFSPYGKVKGPNFARQMMLAAAAGGLDGLEAAMDEFARLWKQEGDRERLRYALMVFLTHYPDAPTLGLRIPSLEERSPWKATPSK